MKRIISVLKKTILFYEVLFVGLFFAVRLILNYFNLEYRQWFYYLFAVIAVLGAVFGISQLINRINKRLIKGICFALFIPIMIFIFIASLFTANVIYEPEKVVTKDGYKFVVYDEGLMRLEFIGYYDYVNWFVCGKHKRLYERYHYGTIVNITWYDDEGNPILNEEEIY